MLFKNLLKQIFIFNFIFSLTLFLNSNAFAYICEEDAAKIAMSHCLKNFSWLLENSNHKLRVESVKLILLNGFAGPVEIFKVTISKYNKFTFNKVNDVLLYEIDKNNENIISITNLETNHINLQQIQNTIYNELITFKLNENINYENYELYAVIINTYGDLILSKISDEKNVEIKNIIFKNLQTILEGINYYQLYKKYNIDKFETNLRSLMLLN